MGIVDDPISGLVGVFIKKAMDTKIWRRVELGIEMLIATSISFLAVTGLALLSSQPVPLAIGAGMAAAAVAQLATFQTSKNSTGLTISIQKAAVEQEVAEPTTTIARS
jgi:hypothetical protein